MKTLQILVLTAVVFLLGTSQSTVAQATWNLATDFSQSNNPNGAWSYGGKDRIAGDPVGDFHLSTGHNDGGWYFEWNGGFGSAWKNVSGGGYPYGIGIGQVSINSDSGNTSTIRWTAPQSGSIDLSGSFGAGEAGVGHRGVFLNNTELFMETASAYNFSTSFAVTAGDVIDFTVWDGGSGGNTPVDATIAYEAVPEPSSLLLVFVVGVAGVAIWQRKRTRRRSAV